MNRGIVDKIPWEGSEDYGIFRNKLQVFCHTKNCTSITNLTNRAKQVSAISQSFEMDIYFDYPNNKERNRVNMIIPYCWSVAHYVTVNKINVIGNFWVARCKLSQHTSGACSQPLPRGKITQDSEWDLNFQDWLNIFPHVFTITEHVKLSS